MNKLQSAIPIIVIETEKSFNGWFGTVRVQTQDLVGSSMIIDFHTDGRFDMEQHVGRYKVPIKGTWAYSPSLFQLMLQGVVSGFQPFLLLLTMKRDLGNGSFMAQGTDGIDYILTPM